MSMIECGHEGIGFLLEFRILTIFINYATISVDY